MIVYASKDDIVYSWERCLAYKLDSAATKLHEPGTASKQTKFSPFMEYTKDAYDMSLAFFANLAANDAVIYYMDADYTVYLHLGSEKTANELKQINFTIGANLSEKVAGTTAAAFVEEPETEYIVTGDDHYLDILKPYTTYCLRHDDHAGRYYVFIITRKERFTREFLAYLELYNFTRAVKLEEHVRNVELKMKNSILDMQYKSQAVVYLDKYNNIIGTNKQFSNWFNLEQSKLKLRSIFDVLPELSPLSRYMENADPLCEEKYSFPSAPANMQTMMLETMPLYDDDEMRGTLLTVTNTKDRNFSRSYRHMHTFNTIIGSSAVIREIKQKAINAAMSNSSVVLTGESGTGKELFAQAIHNESVRKDNHFVSVNCSAIPAELVSSELFGYVEGAFTGGRKGGAIGKFEYADKGTIFLDEIGDMPLNVQTILLRVLEEKAIYRVGSNVAVPIDVRVISATNRNLKKMVEEGTFRMDLYYRINVINLTLPPLKDRKEDIPELLEYYLAAINQQTGKKIKGFTENAMKKVFSYNWPGNLRELRNMVEYAVNNSSGHIGVNDLPHDLTENTTSTAATYMEREREMLLGLMLKHNNNKSKIAHELGISRATLYKKFANHKLH